MVFGSFPSQCVPCDVDNQIIAFELATCRISQLPPRHREPISRSRGISCTVEQCYIPGHLQACREIRIPRGSWLRLGCAAPKCPECVALTELLDFSGNS